MLDLKRKGIARLDRKRTKTKEITSRETVPLFADMLNLLNSLLEKPDTNKLFEAVANSIRSITGADAVFFVENTPDPDTSRVVRYAGPSSNSRWEGVEVPNNESVAGMVLEEAGPVWTSNIHDENYFNSEVHTTENMHSFYGVPIFVNDEIYGVLEVSWVSPHVLTDVERTLLAVSADRIAESLAAIEAVTAEKRRDELRAGLSELAALATKPASDLTESKDNSRDFFERLEEILRVKTVLFVANEKNNPKDAPLHPYYITGGMTEKADPAPYELFKKFADSADTVLIELLEDNKELQQWAKENYGIAHGMVLSNRRVLDSTGCMICGRAEDEPLLSADEKIVLQSSANSMTLGSIDRLLKIEESHISHALQQSLANQVSCGSQFSIEEFYHSATIGSHVGGDFYQVFDAPGDRLVVVLGDVSGKGVDLASLGYLVKSVSSAYLKGDVDTSPAEVVEKLNEILYFAHGISRFVSLILMVVDKNTGTGSYCCAGHPPAFLHRAKTGRCELLDGGSPLVGALDNVEFMNQPISFTHGDSLLLYTDGTTEARAPENGREFFGEERALQAFCSEIKQGFTGVAQRMFERINSFAGGNIGDDLALLALRYNGNGVTGS